MTYSSMGETLVARPRQALGAAPSSLGNSAVRSAAAVANASSNDADLMHVLEHGNQNNENAPPPSLGKSGVHLSMRRGVVGMNSSLNTSLSGSLNTNPAPHAGDAPGECAQQ